MTIRPMTTADHPALSALALRSGFPYPDPSVFDSAYVVTVAGDPVMACGAIKMAELYLYVGDGSPAVKAQALRLLHAEMAADLRSKGYREALAGLPPAIALRFGRRLERMGWVKSEWEKWGRGI